MTAKKLRQLFPKIKLDFPIKKVTTFGVGGKVAGYLRVGSPEALVEAVQLAQKNKLAYQIIAGGSNVVFGDKTLKRIVIHYFTPEAACLVGERTICCNAGLPLGSLINAALEAGLSGIETLSGIPGSVGGAIVGNAGAYGQSIANTLESVEIFDGRKSKTLTRAECKFAYRDSIFKHKSWIVLRANFAFDPGDKKALAQKSKEIIALRTKKYPPNLKCPGSFFKNVLAAKTSKQVLKKIDQSKIIEGKIPAGYLLAEVGAKGMRVGGARVADYHGNLIINRGRATYKEVKKLADILRTRVKKRFGIKLEEEVRYVV